MSFHVGQEVVCVDDDMNAPYGETLPVRGRAYTIRTLEVDEGSLWVRLNEIINKPEDYLQGVTECDFPASAFRPLHKRSTETGFSILEDIRKKASEKKVVEA